RKPEMFRERNPVALVLSDEVSEDEPQLPAGVGSRGAARFAGETLDPIPDPPGSKTRKRQQLEKRPERAFLFDVGEVAPQPLLCLDFFGQQASPRNSESLGAGQNLLGPVCGRGRTRRTGAVSRIGRGEIRRRNDGGGAQRSRGPVFLRAG